MIECPICQVMNEESALFCAECGQRFGPGKPEEGSGAAPSQPQARAPRPKVKLHSPILDGDYEDDEESQDTGYEKPQLSKLRGTSPPAGEQPSAKRGGLRSPLLKDSGGGYDAPYGDGPSQDFSASQQSPQSRPAKKKLRSPLLGDDDGDDDYDDEPKQVEPRGGFPKRGRQKLHSPILGDPDDDDFDDEDQNDYAPGPAKPRGASPRKKLHSPILGGGGDQYYDDDEADSDEPVARNPRGISKKPSGKQVRHKLHSPILGGDSYDEPDDYDDDENEDDDDDGPALRSPLLGAISKRHHHLHEPHGTKSQTHEPSTTPSPNLPAPQGASVPRATTTALDRGRSSSTPDWSEESKGPGQEPPAVPQPPPAPAFEQPGQFSQFGIPATEGAGPEDTLPGGVQLHQAGHPGMAPPLPTPEELMNTEVPLPGGSGFPPADPPSFQQLPGQGPAQPAGFKTDFNAATGREGVPGFGEPFAPPTPQELSPPLPQGPGNLAPPLPQSMAPPMPEPNFPQAPPAPADNFNVPTPRLEPDRTHHSEIQGRDVDAHGYQEAPSSGARFTEPVEEKLPDRRSTYRDDQWSDSNESSEDDEEHGPSDRRQRGPDRRRKDRRVSSLLGGPPPDSYDDADDYDGDSVGYRRSSPAQPVSSGPAMIAIGASVSALIAKAFFYISDASKWAPSSLPLSFFLDQLMSAGALIASLIIVFSLIKKK